jgi:hypothetical protein
MPNKWKGSIADRLVRLEAAGRRCDANNRNCTRSAVKVYTLLPAVENKPTGEPPVDKMCCSYHPRIFLQSSRWVLTGTRELEQKDPRKPRPFDL